jgi:hypothetical protein
MRLIAIAGSGCAALLLAASASASVTFDTSLGGSGTSAGKHAADLCANNRVEPGSRVAAKVRAREIKSAHVAHWIVADPGAGTLEPAELVCAPKLDIWGHTAGPWDPNAPGGPGWLSIACPRNYSPLGGGAGFHISPDRHVTQSTGGFGGGSDGYRHYRFHNWTATTVSIQFWGVCALLP